MAKKKAKETDRAVARLAEFLATGQARPVGQPSADSLRRLSALPLLFEQTPQKSTKSGRVLFDSWADGGVALRDTTAGHVRRLRLGVGKIGLDLVAERQADGWHFTARARVGKKVAHDYVLKVGNRKLLPQSGGYYAWHARSVPRALEMISQSDHIVCEKIVWR
jgi:hypothetical protein